jgi:hypothetical protein
MSARRDHTGPCGIAQHFVCIRASGAGVVE